MKYIVTTNELLPKVSGFTLLSVEESIKIMDSWKWIQYDSETSGRDCHIANILCAQFGYKATDTQIIVDCLTIDIKYYKDILESHYLIGQNLKFDLQFLYNHNIIPRKVYDTMIVEQLLYLGYPHIPVSPEEYAKYKYDFPYHVQIDKNTGEPYYILSFALDALGMKYLHINIDKSVRGEIIYRGLDKEVLEYAANDVVYLEDIMERQLAACREKSCLVGARLECDVVPAMAYLEWCGIKLSEEKWSIKMHKDAQNLVERTKALNDFVCNMSNLPTTKQPFPFVSVNLQGDLFDGFDLNPKCNINWNASAQVIPFVKYLGFKTTVTKKTGEETDTILEKELSTQKGINDEFLKLYFEYKESAKVVGTYGQGHLDLINPNTGRLHTTFKQLGAATGRMSSGGGENMDLAKLKHLSTIKYVNLQQLPHDKFTRSCFVSEPGNNFVSCDFSAEELTKFVLYI